jgi:transposase
LDTTAATISRWKERFRAHGMAGLIEERHPGQQTSVRTPKLQARILAAIKNGPNDGSTHWSCRKLASRFGVSKDTVQRRFVPIKIEDQLDVQAMHRVRERLLAQRTSLVNQLSENALHPPIVSPPSI